MKYFENGEVVKLKNSNGEDFDVKTATKKRMVFSND